MKRAARAALDITHRWAARSLAARGDSPQSMFGIVQGALFQELRRESAGRSERNAVRWFRHRRSRGRREQERARRRVRIHRATPAGGQAALSHGRRHAARYPRSGPSRRGHVRLHHADATRAARRRLHLARFPANAPRRLQILRGKTRSGLRVSDLRALLARLSASPDEDERDARLAAPRETQHPFLSPAHARDSRKHSGRSASSISTARNAPFLHESDLDNPSFARRNRSGQKSRSLGNYEVHIGRGKASPASARFRPARSCIRARRRWKKREDFTSSNRISPSAFGFRSDENRSESRASGHLGCRARRGGERDGGDPLLRRTGRDRSSASAANYQLRKRSRLAAARVPAHAAIFLISATAARPESRRTGVWQSRQSMSGLSWVLVPGDFLETIVHGARSRPT